MGREMVRNTCVSALLVLAFNVPKPVYAGAAIGATEPTQWLNNIQLVLSYIEHAENLAENAQNNVMKFENMARGVLQPIYDVKTTIDNVRNTVKQGLSIAYSVQNLDQVFLNRYKDFNDFMAPGYDRVQWLDDIRNWTQTTEDSIENALTAAGIQMESIEQEDLIMQQIYAQIDGGGNGHQKALDAANEISMMTAKQMQALRQLVATDMQIKSAYYQQQNAIRKATSAAASEFYEPQVVTTPPPVVGDGKTYNDIRPTNLGPW